MKTFQRFSVGLAIAVTAQGAWAQIDQSVIAGIPWREIGPANMSGRIVDVEGIPSPSRTIYITTAAGGVWKTTNGGVTFRPVLDTARVAAGGDMAIAPSDTNVIYVGTGEANSRNSISAGGGIYKSTDGGKSWKHIGLTETRHIGRIQVHPRNPDIVWVAALGAAWGPNEDRGLYKTTDGGVTWRKTKHISAKAGFIDVQLDPRNPNVVWASSYERVRGPYFLISGGPGSALWKSTDGGENWTEVKGGGLPDSEKGRIEIAISPSSPNTMYLLIEAAAPGTTAASLMAGPGAAGGRGGGGGGPTRPSGLYRSEDGGKTWRWMNAENVRPFYYSQVRVHPTKPNRVWWSSTPVKYSNDGGATAGNTTQGLHVDHHAMWIDPKDPERMVVGNDGGLGISFDGGGNWIFPNTFALGQFYNISHDMAVPYRVCGGLQDNGSWCGPSRRRQGGLNNTMWHNVGGGDGFVTQQDWSDPNIMYSESQGGNMGRLNYATNQRTAMQKPLDSAMVPLRWNWNTPFIISRHNPQVLYFGANRLLKSVKRGDGMYFISPDLTARDSMGMRISSTTTGGITPDVTGAERFSTIVSLNESPIRPGLLFTGSDDGKVYLTRNDGGTWEDLTGRFPGVPAGTYVSRIEPSRFDSATFYVTFDNHRRQDFKPYVYTTTDFGRTFRSIANNLPTGQPDYVHVIREDPKNRDLLFVGTDVGLYVSANRGAHWQKFMTGFPTTPVHDLLIHPRDNELIAATHGRSIWIADITPLQQLTTQVASQPAYLFEPRTAYQWAETPMGGGNSGHMTFESPSPQYGADIWYRLSAPSTSGAVRVIIQNALGDTISAINGRGTAGLHRVSWSYQVTPPRPAMTTAQRADSVLQSGKAMGALDSLQRTNAFPRPVLDAVRGIVTGSSAETLAQLAGGRGGGGGGGGGRGGGGFQERPGESAAVASVLPTGRGGAAGGGRGGGGGGAQQEAFIAAALNVDPGQFSQAMTAVRTAAGANYDPFGALGGGFGGRGGGGGGGGGRGGGGPTIAGTGEYVVSITVNGQQQRRRLRVVDVGIGGQASVFP